MIRSFRVVLAVLALAALASASAQAAGNPSSYPQPVVGTAIAYTSNPGGCVNVGDSMDIEFSLLNATKIEKTVNFYFYGVGKPGDSVMKGPLLDVDTTMSGLTPTAIPTVWMWSVKLKPNRVATRVLHVNNVPAGYYPSNWDSSFGPMPWPTLFLGGQGLVRFSRTQLPLYAQIPYCSLDGSIPYVIPQ
jgi:hypothetical protein